MQDKRAFNLKQYHKQTVFMEQWREIDNTNGRYLISSLGRVKRVFKNHTHLINGTPNYIGYMRVYIKVGEVKKKKRIHRLVASAFLPNPECLPEVNHKNFIKTDNRVENLEWCTGQYNMDHARANGRYKKAGGRPKGSISKKVNSKLTEEDVKNIRSLYNVGCRESYLGKIYKVSESAIRKIVLNQTWKHVA